MGLSRYIVYFKCIISCSRLRESGLLAKEMVASSLNLPKDILHFKVINMNLNNIRNQTSILWIFFFFSSDGLSCGGSDVDLLGGEGSAAAAVASMAVSVCECASTARKAV